MKRSFSGMTAQQAPSPRSARQALVSLPGTLHTAFQRPHCTKLTHAFTSTKISSRLTIVEGIELNRFWRSHPTRGPPNVRRDRGRLIGSGSCGVGVTDAIALALHQRDARIVPVHEQADAE